MIKMKSLLRYLGFIQFPLYILGTYYFFHPLWAGGEEFLSDINYALLSFGVALSFSSLSDSTRNQALVKKAFKPSRIKWLIRILLVSIILLFVTAITLILGSSIASDIGTSLFVLGIGLMANLKQLVEMV